MADNTKKELRNQMMYQVFVRNYSKEGTFKALESDIPRIKALGTDIVYLMPIHPIGVKNRKGTLGSPYAISDYRSINPEFGTEDDLKSLVDTIHKNGMKCIIDVVYNHTSPDSVLSQEHPEWFYKKPDGSFGNRVGDWTDVIDLDYSNEDLWDYQIQTLIKWAGIVDGFRCDVAPMVPIAFWERARAEVEKVRPGCIWLAESVEPEFITHLRGRGITALSDSEIFRAFDVSYDYDIYHDFMAYIQGKKDLGFYADAVNRQEYIYPENYIKLRFLENHDQMRAHYIAPDERALRNLTAFIFFQKGLTFIYAGQEYGAKHLPSLFDKDDVVMAPQDGIDLSAFIAKLAAIKKDSIFMDSVYHLSDAGHDICVAEHSYGDKKALGVFSFRGNAGNVTVDMPDGTYKNLIDDRYVDVFHGSISCTGEPMIITVGYENNIL